EANVPGLHEKLLDYLGRLKFRTSYSQNVLQHSIEVAYLTGLLAEEIGLNGALARRCGLLHDIGKAADHEMEGGHPAIGAELTRRDGGGDEAAAKLCRDIAKAVQEQLTYPGEVKVTVLRETRSVEFAR